MRLFGYEVKKIRPQTTLKKRGIQLLDGTAFVERLGAGYTTLDRCPEVMTAAFKVSQLIASMTIYLMANTDKGDIRITNELSRKIDIEPNKNMTRSSWMTAICMNLLLYGQGNSVVYPHTRGGYLESLEPIEAERVTFAELTGTDDYRIGIDGVNYNPSDLLHFTMNPNPHHLWMGQGFQVSLQTVADTLAQASTTKKAFMSSKWKPSIIVKVDALTEEFSSPEGRQKLLDSYVKSGSAGEPWLIPADQFSVEQVRPLSLSDLAVNETVTIDKQTVASILGVPPYLLGVGQYDASEWDSFINNTIRPIAQNIEQEMTRKLILSPKMYLKFNVGKLYSYDLSKISAVYGTLYDKGIVTGNEVREKLGMEHINGLDELIVLENYIPVSEVGNQKKLGGGKDGE